VAHAGKLELAWRLRERSLGGKLRTNYEVNELGLHSIHPKRNLQIADNTAENMTPENNE
jgi:hypothetical protein